MPAIKGRSLPCRIGRTVIRIGSRSLRLAVVVWRIA
jgi:hypothetical protein